MNPSPFRKECTALCRSRNQVADPIQKELPDRTGRGLFCCGREDLFVNGLLAPVGKLRAILRDRGIRPGPFPRLPVRSSR
ncbi:MAG: hypothetical protein BAA03_00070 [Caldibacillus debilis]|nr:MAG: hypothetical protein BAA03_00070 [Caldibacillus debilis]